MEGELAKGSLSEVRTTERSTAGTVSMETGFESGAKVKKKPNQIRARDEDGRAAEGSVDSRGHLRLLPAGIV